MSLINDALKRASQTHKHHPPPSRAEASLQPADHSRRSLSFGWVLPVGVAVLFFAGCLLLWHGLRRPPAQPSPSPSVSLTAPSAIPAGDSAKTLPGSSQPATAAVKPAAAEPAQTAAAAKSRLDQGASPALAQETTSARGAPAPTPAAVVKPGPALAPISTTTAPIAPPVSPTPKAVASVSPTVSPAAAVPQPLAPPEIPNAKFPELRLQGIYYRLSNPTVLINGQTLTVGDIIQGAKVVKIERQSVTLEMAGQKTVLNLR